MKKVFQKVTSISHNKEAKTLIGNFAWLSSLQIAGYVFPLITMPYLARVIGVIGFGKIALASAIMVWIQTIADWGFNFTATRDVAQNRDNYQKVSEIFSNVLWARCLLMILSFFILCLLVLFIPTFRKDADVIFITFLMIPGHILFPDWFFQAIERMKYITILNVLMKFIFTIAVFIFIKNKTDYILQPLFTSLGYVVSGIIALYIILVKWRIKLVRPSIRSILNSIKKSTDVFINNLMPNLYNSFSVMLLGMYAGSTANGIFDGGNKFINICYQLLMIFSRTFFPFLSRRIDKHKTYAILNMGVAFIMASVLYIFSPFIVRAMLSCEFANSVYVLRIMAVSLVFLAISNTYGTNYLIIEHHEQTLRNLTAFSAIIGFAIAWPLIYYYTYIGAALTIVIGRMLLGMTSFVAAKYYMKKNSLA